MEVVTVVWIKHIPVKYVRGPTDPFLRMTIDVLHSRTGELITFEGYVSYGKPL